MTENAPVAMTPMEVAWGYLPGHVGTLPPPAGVPVAPREALERVIRRALERPPCGIAFSGGRDSSLLLAVAFDVARREGLADPIPITKVFPGEAAADEHDWQELVIRHVGAQEWHRISIHSELDLVGPIASRHLRAHGVLWPPMIHGDAPMVEAVAGGTLIDGEGGDEVLGVASHRVGPLTHVLRVPRPVRWRRIRSALGAVAPRSIRMRHFRRRWGSGMERDWLRPAVEERLRSTMIEVATRQPLSFRASVRKVPTRRTQAVLAANRTFLARPHDVDVWSPLLHPEVVHALAEDGGVLGRGSRAWVLRSIAADLLPDAVISRTSKASFNGVMMSAHTREFVADWDGAGLDPDLVDADRLRDMWRSGNQNGLTSALLQAAWLASQTGR